MSSAASRLLSFGNNASLQNLIHRHFLRSSAAAVSGASTTELLNTTGEPQLSSQFNTGDPNQYSNTLFAENPSCSVAEMMKKYSSHAVDGHFPLSVLGLPGVDQSGILKIHTRRTDLSDDSDDADGDFDDSEIDAFDDDYDDNDDDEDYDDDDFDKGEKSE